MSEANEPKLRSELAPETCLCVAADLTLPTQYIRTDTVAGWRKAPVTVGKRPCVFVIQG